MADRETYEDYDQRTWRERAVNQDGQVCIPSMALKQAIDAAGFMLGLKPTPATPAASLIFATRCAATRRDAAPRGAPPRLASLRIATQRDDHRHHRRR